MFATVHTTHNPRDAPRDTFVLSTEFELPSLQAHFALHPLRPLRHCSSDSQVASLLNPLLRHSARHPFTHPHFIVAISLPRGLGPAPGPRARSLGYRPSRRPHHTHPGPPHHGHGSGPGDRAHVPSPAWLPLSSWPHTHPWRTPHVAPRSDGNTLVFAPHAARDPTLG